MRRSGGCLCGRVRWSTDAPVRNVLECHCERCRRLTGNYMAASAAPTAALSIKEDSLRWYSPVDDDNVAYGFCSECGSTLFFRSGIADDSNDVTSMCAGSFDDAGQLVTSQIWFADHAAGYVRIDEPGEIDIFPGQP